MRFRQIPDWSPGYINVCPHHVTIVARCAACGVERGFNREDLPSSMRHALITTIEQRLKCSSCGVKQGKLLFGNYVD